MDIAIERDVPIPEDGRQRRAGVLKNVLPSLQVNESFVYPIKSSFHSTYVSVMNARRKWAPNHKLKIMMETVMVDGKPVPVLINDKEHVRVWRVG